TIERCVILSDGNTIQPSEFIFHEKENHELNDGLVFDSYNLEEIERMIIRRVINKHDGNITKAASELGLTRTSLYRRMEKYGL
ncbi:MAG: hypothetical protein OQJ81_07110, partial [Melioribacteraceae bacterium]|nr:hypothetical protein [Melioribacteraceae bacterium]